MNCWRSLLTLLAWPFIFGQAQANEADDAELPVPIAIYTQAGFNAGPAVKEFRDWQKRFQSDWDAVFGRAQEAQRSEMVEQSPQFFANSIESGKKGLSLKKYLVNGIYSGSPHASDAAIIAKRMMLEPKAKPVGYGGIYEEDGRSIEIWYMALHDLGKMSQEDFKSAAAYSAFNTLALPKYGEGTRGTWPVLLFVRDKDRRLLLYGHSKEMFDIAQKAEWRQYR